jgi:hypothetical protein
MAKFKFENLKFEQIMKDYATILEKTIPDAVHLNARLLCVEFARRTQPFGNDQQVGEKAIARDLLGGKKRYGIFASLTGFMAANAEHYSTGNVRLFVKKDGTVYGTDKAHFLTDATASTLRQIHKGAFQNGTMSSAGSRTRDIGRWKFIDKYFVPGGTLDDYVKSQMAKSGLAKSGWAACANQLKKVISGSMTSRIPGWVTRHLSNYNLGKVEDRTGNVFAPTVVLTNTCKYADKVLTTIEQLNGMAIVAQKMKRQMETILKKRQLKLQEAA